MRVYNTSFIFISALWLSGDLPNLHAEMHVCVFRTVIYGFVRVANSFAIEGWLLDAGKSECHLNWIQFEPYLLHVWCFSSRSSEHSICFWPWYLFLPFLNPTYSHFRWSFRSAVKCTHINRHLDSSIVRIHEPASLSGWIGMLHLHLRRNVSRNPRKYSFPHPPPVFFLPINDDWYEIRIKHTIAVHSRIVNPIWCKSEWI